MSNFLFWYKRGLSKYSYLINYGELSIRNSNITLCRSFGYRFNASRSVAPFIKWLLDYLSLEYHSHDLSSLLVLLCKCFLAFFATSYLPLIANATKRYLHYMVKLDYYRFISGRKMPENLNINFLEVYFLYEK